MFVLVVLSLPTIAYVVLQQKKVQAYIVRNVSAKLSAYLGTSITLTGTDIDIFNNISLYNFCVHDTASADTILFVPELTLSLNTFTLASQFVEIKKVTLHKPDIHFYIDSTGTINFQFIIDRLSSKGGSSNAKPWRISVRDVNIEQSKFTLRSFYKAPHDYGIDFSDISLNPMNIKAHAFAIKDGVIDINVRELSAKDKSGFIIDHLATRLKINKKFMVYNDLEVHTGKSTIHASKVHFLFDDFKQFRAGVFGKKVKLDIVIQKSDLFSNDIAMFLPFIKDYHIRALVSGRINGTFKDLKGKDFVIDYGTHTHIKGNFNINGLPNIKQAFLHVDIKSLNTTPEDIQSIGLPYARKGHVVLPDNFRNITYLTYQGKFTGFVNDFVAYGNITSNLGKINSDLSIRPDSMESLKFEGQLKSTNFDLGTFIFKPEILGKITITALVKGRLLAGKEINARLDGMINNIMFKGYNYANVKVDGTLSNNNYDGAVNINDPNINADFLGKVDLTGDIPLFNFTANVRRANLYKLNFDRSDTSSVMSVYMTANFEANNIDNLNGEIKLWNSTFQKSGKSIHLNDFLLYTRFLNDSSRIFVRSDLADMEVSGFYRFKDLVGSFKSLTRTYLPSLFKDYPVNFTNNNFNFNINFKNTHQVTDYFVPGLYISKDTRLKGVYNPHKKDFSFLCTIPLLQYNSKKWYNVYFNGKSSDKSFSLISGCNNLKINNNNRFDNLTLLTDVTNDTITTHVRWSNWDSATYKGNISFKTLFHSSATRTLPLISFQLNPSEIIIRDTTWNLNSGIIAVDSSEIHIDNIIIAHKDQVIKIGGDISKDKDKLLWASFNNVNLGNLNTILATRNIAFQGVLNGKAEVSNFYRNPLFHASLKVDSLVINNEQVGTAKINTSFNSEDRNIAIEADVFRGSMVTLAANGFYGVDSKKLDFDLNLNKLKVEVFEPFVSAVFSDLHGLATGKLGLTGTLSKPLLNGGIKLQKSSFVVNYLKTQYFISNNTVPVENNSFLFKNFEVSDSKDNKAVVQGKISAENLKDLYIDLSIDAKNFECINTNEYDNSLFYGQGFASGNLTIRGMPKNIEINVNSARTEKHTRIYIPLGTKMELTESNFISLNSKKQIEVPFEQYEIDKSQSVITPDILTQQGLKLNINLEVTPDAEAQIVFDQKIGDIIEGNGSGKISMIIDGGNFNMYGNYIIERGNYLFTMQNIINKELEVEPGSAISWNGNPLDATVNIQAKYKLRASISELIPPQPGSAAISNIDKRRIPVECRLFLTDRLMNPTIRYDINLPNSDQEARNNLNMAINTEEELSRQFLMLLIANSFAPSANSTSTGSSGLPVVAASSSGLEFLSNQFSRMLSQINKDFDVGVNYRQANEVSTNEVEVAMSTQLLNDKVIINGNFDMGGNNRSQVASNSNNSNIVGEGDVEVKLNESGKLRLKVFNRSNQNNITEQYPYTQGIGIFYKEDFNSFRSLFRKYYQMLIRRKSKKLKTEETDSSMIGAKSISPQGDETF